jgi:hypothetical protein
MNCLMMYTAEFAAIIEHHALIGLHTVLEVTVPAKGRKCTSSYDFS